MPTTKPRVYPSVTTEATQAAHSKQETEQFENFIGKIKRFALTTLDDDEIPGGVSVNDVGDKGARDTRMPQLGDLCIYGVERGERNRLWELEARRLTKVAQGSASGLVYPSPHYSKQLVVPKQLDHDSLQEVARVADKINLGLQVCILDDQLALYDQHKQCFERARSSRSYSILQNRLYGTYGLPGWAGAPYWEATRRDPGLLYDGPAFHPPSETTTSNAWEIPSSSTEAEADDNIEGDVVGGIERAVERLLAIVEARAGNAASQGESKETAKVSGIPAEMKVSIAIDPQPSAPAVAALGAKAGPVALTGNLPETGILGATPGLGFEETDDSTHPEKAQPQATKRKVSFDVPDNPEAEPRPPTADHNGSISQVINLRQFCAFVDHLTAVIAYVATKCTPSSYWRAAVLAVLAKLSAKLKILALDLPGMAEGCLRRNDRVQRRRRGSLDEDDDGGAPPRAHDVDTWRFPSLDAENGDAVVARYSVENAVVGRWLQDCVAQVLAALGGTQRPLHDARGLAALDVAVLVFRAGADALPTVVQQDRHGNVGGSGEPLALALTREAVEVAVGVGCLVGREVVMPAGDGWWRDLWPEGEARLEVCLERRGGEDGAVNIEKRVVALADAAALATVLVPLALSQPALGREFQLLLQQMSALRAFGDLSPRPVDFTGLVSLRLGGYHSPDAESSDDDLVVPKSSLSVPRQHPSGAAPLSRSLLAHNRLYYCLKSGTSDSHPPPLRMDDTRIRQIIQDAIKKLNHLKVTSSKWTIEEAAVIVKCPVYVWSIVSLCFVLVAGGMLIGLMVGDRITGVDPFGITNFTWVIAGFILLIAKSVRVSDWPWRDFLLGRVRCRSVTELHSVTGMDAQDIIMLFLSTQARTQLTTCGPFNQPFRNAAAGGFSIDIKPDLLTMMGCGLIPIEVATLQGPHVVFLDITPGIGKRLTSVEHSRRGLGAGETILACEIPPGQGDAGNLAPRIYSNLAWMRVLGLYHQRLKLKSFDGPALF